MDFGKNNIKNIDIILSNKCNLNCFFCNPIKGETYNGDIKKTCLIIKTFYNKGFNSITFSGGEPTLDNNLLLYISFAKRVGFKYIKIQTNLLFSEKYFHKLMNSGITGLGFTHLGLERKTFLSLTGNIGKCSLYTSSLNYVSNYINDIDINVDIVLNDCIIDNIGIETNNLLNLGFNNINYKFPFFTGKNRLNYDLEYYSDKLKDFLIGKDFNFNILYIPTCYLKGLEKKIYDFKYDYIYDFKYFFSLNESIDKIYKKFNECNNCKYIDRCFGFEKGNNSIFKPLK